MKKPSISSIIQRVLPATIRRSYALKIAAIFVLLGITLGSMGLVVTYAVTENVQDSSNRQFAGAASQESRQIESWLQNYYNIANIIADDTAFDTGGPEQISQSFRSRTLQFPSILGIHYVDTSSERIVASTTADLDGESLASISAGWTDDLDFDGQRYVSSPYTNRNVTRIAVSQRVERGADRVVVLELESRVAAPVLGSNQADLDTGYTEVVTATGQVVFSERPSRIGTTYRSGTGSRTIETASSAGVAGTTLTDENPYIRDELRTTQYLVGYDRVDGTDWVVVTHARQDTVYGFARSVFSAGIVATGVVVVFIGLVGVIVGRNTSADIDRLVDKANEMEQGNLTVSFETERIDNIGRLYSEFDRTQRALREQIEQSKLIEHSYDLITVIDATGTVRYQSPSARHIVGLEAEAIEGRNIFAEMHDEDTDTARSAIQRATEEPQNEQRFEFRIQNAAGEWRYFEAVCENHLDDPFVEGLVLSSRDVTERKEREDELRNREQEIERANEQLRQIIDLIPDPLFVKNLDDEILLSNEANADLLGSKPDEIEGKKEPEIMPDVENYERYRQRDIEVIETGESTTFEEELPDPDGDEHIFKITRIPFETFDTDEDAVLGYARDVTDLKEYEQELRKREQEIERAHEQLRQIIDLIPDPLFVKNLDDEVILSNEANAALHGMTSGEIEGKREREIESEVENIENFDKYRQREVEVVETGESTTFEEELKDPDGETHIFKTTRIPFEAVRGDEAVVLGYARDVTDLKEYEQELERLNEEFELLNRILRHDVRNDVVVSSRFGERLADHVDEDGREYLDEMIKRNDHVVELTSALGDLMEARLSDDRDLEPRRIDEPLESEVDAVRSSYDRATVEISGDVPVGVVTADDILPTVFRNLLENAIKHNDQEAPSVTVEADERDDVVVVRVADDGPGVPEGVRETIFGKGEKGLESKGTGIGLYLVATLVDRYGGDVWVEDNHPRGAVFVVELPKAK